MITILEKMPCILTKDRDFIESLTSSFPLKPGTIVMLPEDAVLVIIETEEKA